MRVWVLLAALLAAAPAVAAPAATGPADFIVIGDVPYTADDEAMLANAVPAIKALAPPFVLHVGDMKAGKELCGPPSDRFAALIAALAPIPVIYTPGDNDWTDCDRFADPATGKPFSELGQLDMLRKRFFARPALPRRGYRYVQQRGMPENARFNYADMVFVTLNVPGTNNARDQVLGDDLARAARASEARDLANRNWLIRAFAKARQRKAAAIVVVMQADLTHSPLTQATTGIVCRESGTEEDRACDGFAMVRATLMQQAREFAHPVYLIHGDTWPYVMTRGIFPGDAANIWQLNVGGDVGVSKEGNPQGLRDVTRVTLDPAANMPIAAEGLLTHARPEWIAPAMK